MTNAEMIGFDEKAVNKIWSRRRSYLSEAEDFYFSNPERRNLQITKEVWLAFMPADSALQDEFQPGRIVEDKHRGLGVILAPCCADRFNDFNFGTVKFRVFDFVKVRFKDFVAERLVKDVKPANIPEDILAIAKAQLMSQCPLMNKED